MIKKVQIENWKTHRLSEFEFGSGTNVLVGKMGSGKTSVMDSICFALYGTFPALNTRRISLDEVIMSKPNKMDYTKVSLDFEYHKENYRVERIIFRTGTNEAKLYRGGILLAGPKPKNTNQKIEDILEVNYDLFSRAVYSEQNQIDYFLKLTPSQRKEKFDELLDINKYESVRSNAVRVNNRLKTILQDKKDWLKEQKEKIKEEDIEKELNHLKKKEEENKKLEEEVKEFDSKVKSQEEKIIKLEKKEKEYRFLKELLIRSNGKIEGLEKEITEIGMKLKGLNFEDIKNKEKQEIEKKKLSKKEIEICENEIEKNQEKINKLTQDYGIYEDKLKELEKGLIGLKEAKSSCPICRNKLDHESKQKLEKENLLEQEILQKAKAEKLYNRKAFEEEQKKSKGKINHLKKEIEEIEKRHVETERLIEKEKNLESKKKELTSLKEEIVKLEKQVNEYDFDEKELRKERDEIIKIKTSLEGLKKEISLNKEIISEIKTNIERSEERKKQIKELEKNVIHLEEMNSKISIFVNALKGTQAELRESLVNTINEAMEDIWEKIYPYKDYNSCKIEVIEGNYEILVRQKNKEWVRVEGILSGGERSAVAITIRIAISLVLTRNLSWLILDEPTHNLDIEAVKKLTELTRDHLPELVEQIFIITHEKEMEKAASATLYLLEREKETDGSTKPMVAQVI